MGNIAKRRPHDAANPTMAMDEMPAAVKERQHLEKLHRQVTTKNWKDAPQQPKKEGKKVLRVTEAILQRARDSIKRDVPNPFRFPDFPKSCTPSKDSGMAMDDVFGDTTNNDFSWASHAFLAGIGAAYQEGLVFPGYTYLAELAQRPEYRVLSEIIAEEMTRKWIKITSKSDDEDKTDKIRELTDALDKLKIREAFQQIAEVDGFFGRAHLYIDIRPEREDEGSDTTVIDREELKTPIGNGRDDITKSKVPPGSFKRVKVVEPVWTYPTNYNASDPLSTEWYLPDMWYVMGKQIHSSRLLRFVGREVPDILKPAYAFGGLSMSQMAKPYVDNWLKTRQSVADIISAFSVFVLSTDMGEVLMDQSEDLFKRIDLFNLLRNNKGTMVINKDSEEFQNVAAPLGTLDSLQAQTQEHMASVGRVPIVKLLGIQPAGLNASSEGEIRTFYDHIHAYQEKFYKPNLEIIFNLTQMSLWGEVDDDLVFNFVELWELDAAALSTKNKTDADAGIALVQAGIISVEEERKRIANDPDTPYQSLDIQDIPEPPQQEGMPGMEGMEGMEDGSEAGTEEGGAGPAEGTPGGELGERGGPDRGGGGGGNVVPLRQRSRNEEGTDDLEGGGPSDSGPEDGGMEETGIRKSDRNKLTAAAALVRQERRKKAAGGSFRGDAAYDANPFENFCTGLSAVWLALAMDKQWKEEDHPRDSDGKFAAYGVAPGLKNKANKLGFTKWSESDSGKIKLTHANGSVLVVEPPGEKGGQSQIYSFYPADGSKPIKAQLTGQSGKSFFEKVSPLLDKPQVKINITPEQQEGLNKLKQQMKPIGSYGSFEEYADAIKATGVPPLSKNEEASAKSYFANKNATQSQKDPLARIPNLAKVMNNVEDAMGDYLSEINNIQDIGYTKKQNEKFAAAVEGLSYEEALAVVKKLQKENASEKEYSEENQIAKQEEKLVLGDPEGVKKGLFDASNFAHEHLAQKYLSKLEGVQDELNSNKDFKEAAGDYGLSAEDIVKLYKGEAEKYGEPSKGGNTAAELKQQWDDGLITHEEYIDKLKEIAKGPSGIITAASLAPSFDGQPGEALVNDALDKGLDIVNVSPEVIVLKMPDGTKIRIGKHGTWVFGAGTTVQKDPNALKQLIDAKLAETKAPLATAAKKIDEELKTRRKGKVETPPVKVADYANYEEFEKAAKAAGMTDPPPHVMASIQKYYAAKNKAADPAVLEQAKKASEAKNKMFKSLHDKGYKNEPNPSEEVKGIISFKSGDKEFKIAANGDWLASSPGFSAKAGSGEENLNAFLAGEKAYGTKWNKGDPSTWLDEHDNSPDKAQKLAEKQAKEAEAQAKAKANALEQQNIEALKKIKAEEEKKKTEAQLAAMKAEHAKQSAASQKLLHSWAATQPQPNAQAKSAVKSYTGSGYSSTNEALRHGDIDLGDKGPNKALHSWINSCSFPEDMTLYRTVKSDFARMLQAAIPEGSNFMDKGFSSMTADPNFLWGYSKENKQTLRLQIKVKKGAKAAAVSTMSSSGQGEAEVIGNAGAMFKVIKQHGNYWEVELMDDNYWDS